MNLPDIGWIKELAKAAFNLIASAANALKSKFESRMAAFNFPSLTEVKLKLTLYTITDLNDPRIGKIYDQMFEAQNARGIYRLSIKLSFLSPERSELRSEIDRITNYMVAAQIHPPTLFPTLEKGIDEVKAALAKHHLKNGGDSSTVLATSDSTDIQNKSMNTTLPRPNPGGNALTKLLERKDLEKNETENQTKRAVQLVDQLANLANEYHHQPTPQNEQKQIDVAGEIYQIIHSQSKAMTPNQRNELGSSLANMLNHLLDNVQKYKTPYVRLIFQILNEGGARNEGSHYMGAIEILQKAYNTP